MEEEIIITLKCTDCDNTECKYNSKWIHQDSNNGCTRRLDEETAAQYFHYLEEIIPFMYSNTKSEYQKRIYNEILDFLYNSIYVAPLGQIIRDKHKRL